MDSIKEIVVQVSNKVMIIVATIKVFSSKISKGKTHLNGTKDLIRIKEDIKTKEILKVEDTTNNNNTIIDHKTNPFNVKTHMMEIKEDLVYKVAGHKGVKMTVEITSKINVDDLIIIVEEDVKTFFKFNYTSSLFKC